MTSRSKTALAVGSAQWIQNECDQAQQFHELEVEEFGYAARNELDWLNEHMAEIFSRDQRNFADVFKTPGKLRGRTPMTARKRDPVAARAPLTDLFAPNPQAAVSPAVNTAFYQKVSAQFVVAEDKERCSPPKGTSRRSPQRVGKGNADSGYHGITEDEMDVDSRNPSASQSTLGQLSFVQPVAVEPALETLDEVVQTDARPTNDDEFLSAIENNEKAGVNTQETDDATVLDEDMEVEAEQIMGDDNERDAPSSPPDESPFRQQRAASGNWQVEADEGEENDANDDKLPEAMDEDDDEDEAEAALDSDNDADMKSPSDASTPDKPLVRKSSLTFAALPARETFKRSLGARNSHIDALGRTSVVGRQTHGKSFGTSQQPAEQGETRDEAAGEEADHAEMSEEHGRVAEPHKTSTQILHEKITALGQPKQPRPSKSIPSLLYNSGYPEYPVLPKDGVRYSHSTDDNEDDDDDDDDDDDWIAPIKTNSRSGSGADTKLAPAETEDDRPSTAGSIESLPAPAQPKRVLGHQKSYSTITLSSPNKRDMGPHSAHKKAESVSNPNLAHVMGVVGDTTPTSSPGSKRFADAPISASKAKLYSVLKSAKGIFASSASASAQAKMDGLASPSHQSLVSLHGATPDLSKMPGAFSDLPSAPKLAEGRKTRSSTESDRRQKDSHKHKNPADELEQARQKERQRAAEQKEERERSHAQRPATAARTESQRSEEQSEADDMPPPPPPKSMLPPGKLRAPGRLVRPTRPATAPSRPAPVNIKIASQSQRLNTAQPDRSLEPTPPPATTRTRAGSVQPSAAKAGPAAATARVRALEAAARKKEQDEKAAQRKADQKRELERKRAAKAEEERRAEEERKAAEQKRVREERVAEQRRMQESRVAAQRQAEQRRAEEQRMQAAQEKMRADQLAAALEQEKQDKMRAQASYPRGDVQGTLRQLAQKEMPRPATAQGKMSKRAADPEDEPQRPGLQRGPASYQQQDNKRRRTLEEDEGANVRHSVMAPPKRPSNMRKNTQDAFGKFPNGYTHAPPPAAHHTQGINMYKATVTSQHMQHTSKAPTGHPNDMLKLSTARIPFAESSSNASSQPSALPASSFKTPGRPASARPVSTAKSSPMYVNGENIALPEIASDSEDESDSDDDGPPGAANGARGGGFRAPSWVASPALRELLTQQQLVDPESVFGPIAPLHMDEVFKGSKTDRLKRFRERGSSARWVESGDAVTEEEKRKDGEMRGLLHKEGGWNYRQQMR